METPYFRVFQNSARESNLSLVLGVVLIAQPLDFKEHSFTFRGFFFVYGYFAVEQTKYGLHPPSVIRVRQDNLWDAVFYIVSLHLL